MTLIEAALKSRCIRQTEAARVLGISRSHMNDLVRGRRKPSLALALRIEHAFEVPASKLNADVAEVRASARTGAAA
jgi:transcriptional regulator with XRE-family HTH domain